MKRFLLSLIVLAFAGHAGAQAAITVSDAPSLLKAIAGATSTPSVVMVQPGEYVGKIYGAPGTKTIVNVAVPNGVQLTLLAAHGGGTGGGPPPPPPPPPPTSCPYATDGGFSGANSASLYQIANFKTYVTSLSAGNVGSGQSWTGAHPQTNCVPDVDYPIGPYTPIASMADPATANWSGTGCSYSATSNTGGGPLLRCNGGPSSITFAGYDFGPKGAHGCTQVYISGSTTVTTTFTNDHFEGDSVCENNNGYVFRNDTTAANAMTVVTFTEIDGNNRGNSTGSPAGDFKMDASGAACTRGVELRYVYWHDSINRPMNSCAFGVVDIKYSAFVGYAVAENRTGIHGELWQGAQSAGTGGTAAAVDFDYNLVRIPNTNPSPGVCGVYLHTGQSNITALTVTNNFVDAIGSLNCLTNPLPTTIGTFTESGNIDLETGGTITGFAAGAGHGQACPPLFSS